MARYSIYSKIDISNTIRELKICTRRQILLKLTGGVKRVKALEYWLPELEEMGEVDVIWFQGEKVYSPVRKRRKGVSIEHEIGVSECRVRLEVCRQDGIYVPERKFRGLSIVPDGALAYANGKILLWEFSTKKNFAAGGVIRSKLTRYHKHLWDIGQKFNRKAVVLFVIDDDHQRIKQFIHRNYPVGSEVLWIDYYSFKQVPIGYQLSARVYLWEDGKYYPLTDND